MIKLFTLVSLILSAGVSFAEECPMIAAAPAYQMKQVYLTIGTDFDLYSTSGQYAGKIIEKVFNPRPGKTFDLVDDKGQRVARARERFFSFFTKIDVFDCHKRFIGSLQKNYIRSKMDIGSSYSILDAKNKVVGQSRKLDLLNSEITFYDTQQRIVAVAHRPVINVARDSWDVQIYADLATFDPRVFLFAPAFKTAKDSK